MPTDSFARAPTPDLTPTNPSTYPQAGPFPTTTSTAALDDHDTIRLACGHAYAASFVREIVADEREDKCLICGPHAIPPSALQLATDRVLTAVLERVQEGEEDEDAVLLELGKDDPVWDALDCPLTGTRLEGPGMIDIGCWTNERPVTSIQILHLHTSFLPIPSDNQ